MDKLQEIEELKNIYNGIKQKINEFQTNSPQSSDELYKINIELTQYMNTLLSVEDKLDELYTHLSHLNPSNS